jgi:hypothetical protein
VKLLSTCLPGIVRDLSVNGAPPVPRTIRSKGLDLDAYDTDKIRLGYIELYDPILTSRSNKEIKLLEVGVKNGGSLKLWRDYFPHGTIVGIDRKLPQRLETGERIQVFQGDQADTAFLSKVASRTAPDGFDIIIDDASHIGELTKATFWHLFDRHLKPGGLYAIEDWGTGYLDDFPDGKRFELKPSILARLRSFLPRRWRRKMKIPFPCHSYGMVGFVKELVDEQGAGNITLGRKGDSRFSKFRNLLITPGIVFVTKATATLRASPDLLPAKGKGKTTISWNSVDGKIYVSRNGGNESLFSGSPRGSQDANWIKEGFRYEFRLYNAAHTQLLDKVVVTKATA